MPKSKHRKTHKESLVIRNRKIDKVIKQDKITKQDGFITKVGKNKYEIKYNSGENNEI